MTKGKAKGKSSRDPTDRRGAKNPIAPIILDIPKYLATIKKPEAILGVSICEPVIGGYGLKRFFLALWPES